MGDTLSAIAIGTGLGRLKHEISTIELSGSSPVKYAGTENDSAVVSSSFTFTGSGIDFGFDNMDLALFQTQWNTPCDFLDLLGIAKENRPSSP